MAPKGTGRACQGSTRAPQWRHGGIVFGPTPRSYAQDMPRKMRRLALRSALSAKAAEQQIVVVDKLDMNAPRTKAMVEFLSKVEAQRSTLILLPDRNQAVGCRHAICPMSRHCAPAISTCGTCWVTKPWVLPLDALSQIETFLAA